MILIAFMLDIIYMLFLKNDDDIKSFNKWIRANKLTMNFDPTKSCYSIFKPQNKTIPNTYKKKDITHLHIRHGQNTWEIISTMSLAGKNKYLNSIKKVNKYIGIFCKLIYFVPKKCLMALYNAFIFPRLNYGIEAYTNAKSDYLKKLITSQNKSLRILQFKPFLYFRYQSPV